MSNSARRLILALCVLTLAVSTPRPASAQQAGACETACAVGWIGCIVLALNGYADGTVCNYGYDGCMWGCQAPA